jgi:hypothetical protein
MAILIAEPANENPGPSDWMQNLLKMTMTTGGLLMIGLDNMDNENAPVIRAGSRFEINGSFYCCETDETVSGDPDNNVTNYIYAAPDGTSAFFEYAATEPVWQPDKGGWFDGTKRAVVKFFYTGGQYNGKVILDGHNAINEINRRQPIPATGGLLVVNGMVNTVKTQNIPPGMYRWEMKGGTGGRGGNSTSAMGGTGAQGSSASGVFQSYKNETVYFLVGGNGAPGGDAVGGGGGGGGSGGSSFLDISNNFMMGLGGSGGGGATGYLGTGGGGGGGGANGIGGNGGDGPGGGTGGTGGNIGLGGTGGRGGDGGGSGGGGSGLGVGGGSTPGTGGIGSSGGGYGGAGGAGGTDSIGSVTGGPGGVSAKGEGAAAAVQKYDRRMQYQGGGGGGGYYSGGAYPGGAGGGAPVSVSDGYVRMYRMW